MLVKWKVCDALFNNFSTLEIIDFKEFWLPLQFDAIYW